MANDSKGRFSSLNVFKFGSSSSSTSSKPPPPPPKDPFYASSTYNRSQLSLQSPTDSVPATPLSAHGAPRPFLLTANPSFNASKMSLVSSSADSSSAGSRSPNPQGVSTMNGQQPPSSGRKPSFFRFGSRKSTKSRPTTPAPADTPPKEDEGISMPWNFQHQIHVNESLVGLPPSWSAQLVQAGFNEEEIMAIHARRMASASTPSIPIRPASPATTLSSSYSYSAASANRPQSPSSIATSTTTNNISPPPPPIPIVVSRPAPRSSSLSYSHSQQQQPTQQHQQQSQTPLHQQYMAMAAASSSPSLPYRPPLYGGIPSHRTNPSITSLSTRSRQQSFSSHRNRSESSSSISEIVPSSSSPSTNSISNSPPLPPPQGPPPPIPVGAGIGAGVNQQQQQQYRNQNFNHNRTPSIPSIRNAPNSTNPAVNLGSTGTPPRRVLVVANTDPGTPPPAYPGSAVSKVNGTWPADVKDRNLFTSNNSTNPSNNETPPPAPVSDAPSTPSSTGDPTSPARSPLSTSATSPTTPAKAIMTPRKSKRFSTSRPPRLSLHSPSSSLSSAHGGNLDVSFGLGLNGWSDSVFEAIGSAASEVGSFLGTTPTSSASNMSSCTTTTAKSTPPVSGSHTRKKSGGGSLLPAIVLPPSSSASRSAKPTIPIVPLSLASSSSLPISSPSISGEPSGSALLTVDGSHAPAPGESSPMWNEILDIMEKQSSPASRKSPRTPGSGEGSGSPSGGPRSGEGRSFGLKAHPPPQQQQQQPTMTVDEHVHPLEDGEDAFDEEGEDAGSGSRFSTATLLASSYYQRPNSGASYLSTEDMTMRGGNRDSSQSTSSTLSTVTVTGARVQQVDVRGVRAMASFVNSESVNGGKGRKDGGENEGEVDGEAEGEQELSDDDEDEGVVDVVLEPASPRSLEGEIGSPRSAEWSEDDGQVIVIPSHSQMNGHHLNIGSQQQRSPRSPPSPSFSAALSAGLGVVSSPNCSLGVGEAGAGGAKVGLFPHSPVSPGTPFISYYENRSPEPDRMEFIDRALEERDAFAAGEIELEGDQQQQPRGPKLLDEPEEEREEETQRATSTTKQVNGFKYATPSIENLAAAAPGPERPKILINGAADARALLQHKKSLKSVSGAASSGSSSSFSPPAPLTNSSLPSPSPSRFYRGWLSEVVRPLEGFIDEAIDPRKFYTDMVEIAECESGSSVYAAKVVDPKDVLKLSPFVRERDRASSCRGEDGSLLVAIKSVPMSPGGSPKLRDIERELRLLRDCCHPHVLGPEGVYVDLTEDSLWLRMELMERSVADVIMLIGEGLMLQERMMARMAMDVLEGLVFLESRGIAHRDLRSDNLLISKDGLVKIADFSSAVQVTPTLSVCSQPAGVIYWQAPEMREGPYDPMKVDLWSLGATVWEMAETQPPFAGSDEDDTVTVTDRWPELSRPELYSPGFHEFLALCSEPVKTRPGVGTLLKNQFIHNACGRPVIVQLLAQCSNIEQMAQERDQAS